MVDSQHMTKKQQERALRKLKQQERFDWADRQISLFRGSTWMCCLQPALTFYTNLLAAQIQKDEAEEQAEMGASN